MALHIRSMNLTAKDIAQIISFSYLLPFAFRYNRNQSFSPSILQSLETQLFETAGIEPDENE